MRALKSFLRKNWRKEIASVLPRNISIEVCSACNHRCSYCPVHDDPFRQKVMSMEDFRLIIENVKHLSPILRISLNHYNEPFMDPYVIERIKEVSVRKITPRILLNTNASMIQLDQIKALLPHKSMLDFNINLPTVVSEERYKKIHGRKDLKKVQQNIAQLLQADFLVRINIQKNMYTTDQDYNSVIDKYEGLVRHISLEESITRANLVFEEKIHHTGKILGCSTQRDTDYLHVGVGGEIFLCCQDYHKNYQFGNLISDSFETIWNSTKRKQLLSFVGGENEAPDDFICRSCEQAIVEMPTV